MPDVHAKLSASGSAKWLPCPAAMALEAVLDVPDTGSKYAREGTAAHEVLEICLRDHFEPDKFLNSDIKLVEETDSAEDVHFIKVTQEMVDAVEVAKEYVDRLQAKTSFYEERVDYSHVAPGGFGTADIIKEVYEKTAAGKRKNKLYVIDFKYGAGVSVSAYKNSQGMLYGLGALNSLDLLFEREIESVVVVIIQPRMDNISEFEISVEDLIKWGQDVVRPSALKANNLVEFVLDAGEAALMIEDFNPTKKGCQWCQGKRLGRCKALAQQGFEAAVEGFSDLTVEQKTDLPAVSKDNIKSVAILNNNDIASIFRGMTLFKSFIKDLDKEIRKRIKAGEVIPGLELIPTLKARAWDGSEEEIIKGLRTAGLKKPDYEVIKIITPTQAEAKLKKVKPEDFIKRYKKLEKALVKREAGEDKIVETIKKSKQKQLG